jgi:hypothetical protein
MLRTGLAESIALVVALAACGGERSKLEASGPAFSPLIANALRAIADDCKFERVGGTERRDCTGRHGTVHISLVGNKFSQLTIALPSKILPEAKGHFGPALLPVLGQAGIDQLIGKLGELVVGQNAELSIGGATIYLTAGGRSRIAPEYTVELRW